MNPFWPKSSFEAFTTGDGKLIVVAHWDRLPLYLGIVLALIALLPALASLSPRANKKSMRKAAGVIVTLGILLALTGTEQGKMVFDRQQGQIRVEKTEILLMTKRFTVNLDDVRYAEVRESGADEMFCVVVKGGGCFNLKSYMSDGGQHEAADAVNEYLGKYPPR